MTHPRTTRSSVSLAMIWVCGIAICGLSGLASGQGSHRPLDPPTSPGTGMGANADLLRQLQQAVEQSDGPGPAPIDPSQIDPKLMEALMNLAGQLKENPELSPQMQQWMQALAENQGLSVPQDLNSFPPGNPLPQPDPNRPDREHVFDLRQNRPSGDPATPGTPRNPNQNGPPRPNTGSPNVHTPGGENRFQPGGSNSSSGPRNENRAGAPTPGTNRPPGQPGENPLPREATAEERTSAPRNINLEQLRDSGMSIQQQFDRVVEQARRDAIMNRSDRAGEDQQGGLGGLFNEALAKSSDELLERLSKSRQGNPADRPRNRNRNSSPDIPGQANPAQGSPLSKQFESLSNQAQRLGRSITDAQVPATAAASPETEFTAPSASTSFSILTVLLAIAALGAVAYALLTWQRRNSSFAQRRPAPTLPARLTTRQEVLRAFHTLSAMTGAGEHWWWTHRRAGNAMAAAAAPQARTAVEALTQVYEQARYLPPNEPLDPGQLRVAGEAIGIMGQAHPVIELRGEK